MKSTSEDVRATTPTAVLEELRARGYDPSAALSYVMAARSWTERGSPEHAVWLAAEAALRAEMP